MWWTVDWPEAAAADYPGGLVLRDRSGEVLRVTLGPNDTDCRPYYTADPSDWIVRALVAVEDGTFWTHCGVRPLSILRAAGQNLFYGRRISGASTLSMQTVRLIKSHPKTLLWKVREAIMALKMERAKDKIWILSQYLNRAPFGSNLVGIEAAAQGWFGKSPKALGLGEAALLAGMVQAPSRFRPDRNLKRALKRRDYVLRRLGELGWATPEQIAAARTVLPEIRRAPRPFKAPFYCDWFVQETGITHGDVTTPLEADVQSACEAAVDEASAAGGYAASAVVLRVADGAVLALACSGDYFGAKDGQVNTALAPRPAGSTLKPFLAALALDRGLVTPEERLLDAPVAFKGYRPANFDNRYRGRVTLRDALVLSLNIPFVRLLHKTGAPAFADNLRTLGFRHLGREAAEGGLGMAIGNVEVSLLELVRAYGTLAREGGGVYSPEAAYLVADMLSGRERTGAALGHVADVACPRFAWKTGTSSAYRDAWTVLWNPEYVVGVWCGHKSGGFGDTALVGAKAAAPVAWKIARRLYPAGSGPWYGAPPGVFRRTICSLTGLAATADCPETEEGRALRGRTPATLCAAHRRNAAGRPVRTASAAEASVRILCPEADAVYECAPGREGVEVVCSAAVSGAQNGPFYWFVDGHPAGRSEPDRPFVVELGAGTHTLTCATEAGDSAAVSVTVHPFGTPNGKRGPVSPRVDRVEKVEGGEEGYN